MVSKYAILVLGTTVLIAAVGAADSGPTVRPPPSTALDCDAPLTQIIMPQEAEITIYTSLFSGIATWVRFGQTEAAYFDHQGWTANNEWIYNLSGHTTQYSCGLVCDNPLTPTVEEINDWVSDALDAIAQTAPPPLPPVCAS